MINVTKIIERREEVVNLLRVEGMPEYINESLQGANQLLADSMRSYGRGLNKSLFSHLDTFGQNLFNKIWLAFGKGTDSVESVCHYILDNGLSAFLEQSMSEV